MMNRFTRSRWVLLAGVAVLSSCSWTGNLFGTKPTYESAQQSQGPLEVPPDLSQLPRDERFVVPERPQTVTASGQRQAARPGTPGATPAAATPAVVPAGVVAKIERQGSQRWLAVNMPPERVWPVLVEFWPTVGMQIEKADPKTGVMETKWAETRSSVPEQGIIRRALGMVFEAMYSSGRMDKYRARIERTSADTSEIFITHREMEEVYTSSAQDQTRWQPRPADPEREAEMLQRLLQRFVATAAAPVTTAASAGAPSAPKPGTGAAATAGTSQLARIAKGSDGRSEQLEIDDSFDRAWRRVGLALDRGAFTVEDRDRAKGIYFVRYLDPDYESKVRAEQGLFSKIFSSDKPVPAPQYRVVVSGQSTNRTVVTVQGADGTPERSPAADRILALLNDQLR